MIFKKLNIPALILLASLSCVSCDKEPAPEQAQASAPTYAQGSPEAVATTFFEAMLKGDYVAFSTALKLEKQLESSQLNAVSAKLEELFKPYLENLKRDTASCGGLEQITVKEVSYPKGKTDEAIAHLITSFKDHSKKPHEDTVKLIWINDEWLPSLDQ